MNKFQLISSFILLTIFVEILIIIQFLYHDWSTSIDVIVSIIAFLAFFGGYAKLMDYFKSKPNLKIEQIDIIQDRTHIEFTIKNNGNAFSNNPLICFTLLKDNEVIKSVTGSLLSDIGILPPETTVTRKFGIPQLNKNDKYKIFIEIDGNEIYKDITFPQK